MYTADTVGFIETAYVVEEGAVVAVCAEVMSPNIPCPFDFGITLLLSTRDDTAGTVSYH